MPETAQTRQKRSVRRQPNLELIALRVNAGLSREELSRRTALGRETIRLAEAGFVPTPRVQFALASAFKRQPLDLWPIEKQRRPRYATQREAA